MIRCMWVEKHFMKCAVGLSAILFAFVSIRSHAADKNTSPPFKTEDIRIASGIFAPCLSLDPDEIEFIPAVGTVIIYMKQTLKKPIKACERLGMVMGMIHDHAGNEMWDGSLSLPVEVGNTNRKPIQITWVPSKLKLPLTMKLRPPK